VLWHEEDNTKTKTMHLKYLTLEQISQPEKESWERAQPLVCLQGTQKESSGVI